MQFGFRRGLVLILLTALGVASLRAQIFRYDISHGPVSSQHIVSKHDTSLEERTKAEVQRLLDEHRADQVGRGVLSLQQSHSTIGPAASDPGTQPASEPKVPVSISIVDVVLGGFALVGLALAGRVFFRRVPLKTQPKKL